MSRFPHLDTDSAFPDLGNVDVYKYDNQFDYDRYDEAQMDILLCSVPWDMGEAHIGNRTIGGIGNVVHFGTKAARDAWFDDLPSTECYRKTTKYKRLPSDNALNVEIPFDVASRFNYVAIDYHLFASDNSPVAYEDNTGIRQWFYFIREVEFIAPNTTRLHLLIDAFQTFIYDVDITGMVLERGHAPMLKTKVATYLANPLNNTKYISAPDVSYGEPVIARKNSTLIYNDTYQNMYAVIISSANPKSSEWGTKAYNDWMIPTANRFQDGVYSYFAIAIAANQLSTFITSINGQVPQFLSTIKAIAYVPKNFVSISGESVTFAGVTCYYLMATGYKSNQLYSLSKADFGFSSEYADITKLYTYPYSVLRLSDFKGREWYIHIEDTTGTLNVISNVNLIFPWLKIDSHINGIGKAGAVTVNFATGTNLGTYGGGNWTEYFAEHNIPMVVVRQGARRYNDYSTHFDREQAKTAAQNTYDSTVADATTAKDNATDTATANQSNTNATATANKSNVTDSATANYDNAVAIANTLNANATLQQNANTANTNASTTRASNDSSETQYYNTTSSTYSQSYTGDMAISTINADQMQAAISAGATTAHSAVSGIGSILGLDLSGAVTAGFNGIIDSAATIASTGVGVGLTTAQAFYHNAFTGAMASLANYDTSVKTTNAINMVNAQLANTNSLIANTSANSATTTSNNAGRSYNADTGNATRTYNAETANATRTYNADTGNATRSKNTAVANATRTKSTATSAIDNQVSQASLRAPEEFGTLANGENITTRPMGWICNVLTQSDGDIALAGDEMLRYGYMYNRNWAFDGDWTPCKYFTYWKLKDMWIKSLSIPDMYIDRIRLFLFEGVTIWKNPEDIGNVTIYENVTAS